MNIIERDMNEDESETEMVTEKGQLETMTQRRNIG